MLKFSKLFHNYGTFKSKQNIKLTFVMPSKKFNSITNATIPNFVNYSVSVAITNGALEDVLKV